MTPPNAIRVPTAGGSTLELRELTADERAGALCALCGERVPDVAVAMLPAGAGVRAVPARLDLGVVCGNELAGALSVRFGAAHVRAGGSLQDLAP